MLCGVLTPMISNATCTLKEGTKDWCVKDYSTNEEGETLLSLKCQEEGTLDPTARECKMPRKAE